MKTHTLKLEMDINMMPMLTEGGLESACYALGSTPETLVNDYALHLVKTIAEAVSKFPSVVSNVTGSMFAVEPDEDELSDNQNEALNNNATDEFGGQMAENFEPEEIQPVTSEPVEYTETEAMAKEPSEATSEPTPIQTAQQEESIESDFDPVSRIFNSVVDLKQSNSVTDVVVKDEAIVRRLAEILGEVNVIGNANIDSDYRIRYSTDGNHIETDFYY